MMFRGGHAQNESLDRTEEQSSRIPVPGIWELHTFFHVDPVKSRFQHPNLSLYDTRRYSDQIDGQADCERRQMWLFRAVAGIAWYYHYGALVWAATSYWILVVSCGESTSARVHRQQRRTARASNAMASVCKASEPLEQ